MNKPILSQTMSILPNLLYEIFLFFAQPLIRLVESICVFIRTRWSSDFHMMNCTACENKTWFAWQ